MKKKTALITGIGGQDASFLAEILHSKDYRVTGILKRNATGDLGNSKHLENVIDIIEGDITDMASMLRIIDSTKPHEIYNLAAMSHVHTSFEQPLSTLEIDTKGLVNILEVVRCIRPQTRILHTSTSEMFGASPAPQNMETPFMPQSPYAIAKVASHHFIRLYREAYKMFACAAISFNHECLFHETPVILKIDNYIDIQNVGSLIPNRVNCRKDSSELIKDYKNSNIEIWDGENFVKLLAVSRKKLINLDLKNQKKIITNTPHGIVYTTPNHKLFNIKSQKSEAKNFSEGDKLLHGNLPLNFSSINSVTDDLAKLYGMLCSNGFVSNQSIQFTNNNKDIQNEFLNLISKCFVNTKFTIDEFVSGRSILIRIDGLSEDICSSIRNKLYDNKTKKKKVPTEILNSSLNIKRSFFNGFLSNNQKSSNYEFKSNSPILTQGLLYILKQIYPDQDYCLNFSEKNDNIYLHTNLNPNKIGEYLEKDTISKIMSFNEENQHVFDIETESGRICAGVGEMIIGNSPRRGPNFVTRKISMAVAQCLKDPEYKLKLGNLNAKRDWGFSPDYCEGFWMTLQQEDPDDYIFATNEMHTVQEFCEVAFSHVGLNWKDHVIVDRFFMRPAEVNELCGDYSLTKEKLGWEPKVRFEELVKIMVDSDCELLGVSK